MFAIYSCFPHKHVLLWLLDSNGSGNHGLGLENIPRSGLEGNPKLAKELAREIFLPKTWSFVTMTKLFLSVTLPYCNNRVVTENKIQLLGIKCTKKRQHIQISRELLKQGFRSSEDRLENIPSVKEVGHGLKKWKIWSKNFRNWLKQLESWPNNRKAYLWIKCVLLYEEELRQYCRCKFKITPVNVSRVSLTDSG